MEDIKTQNSTQIQQSEKEENVSFGLDVEEMAKEGLHFGHKTSALHPKMEPFIFGVRNTVHIINLEKTKEKLEKALKFIETLIKEGKILLLVGTKIQIKDIVKKVAQECNLPYVNERWLGGTFTNFETILKRVEYLKELEKKKEAGEFDKYTKKEKKKLEDELQKLKTKFEGLKNLPRLPDAVFICDMKKEHIAVTEARKKGVKIIAIADTNADPTLADYPIPANDDAISSVKYILEKVKQVILKTKSPQSQ